MIESGEQWDFPNVWPPLEHMIITGRHHIFKSKDAKTRSYISIRIDAGSEDRAW